MQRETGGECAEKGIVINLGANIAELVSKGLETKAIFVDGGVFLVAPKKLLLQEDAALEAIVGEEPVQLGPNSMGIVAVVHDHME